VKVFAEENSSNSVSSESIAVGRRNTNVAKSRESHTVLAPPYRGNMSYRISAWEVGCFV